MAFFVTYARLVKFSHTAFAMPFALLGAFLAAARWQGDFVHQRRFWVELGLVVLAMVAARSAAMAFNRIVDRRFDAANPRTAARELPAGKLSPRQAWTFYFACAGVFLATCLAFFLLYGNPWPIALALPVLTLLSAYSLAKRYTAWCHVALGASLGISPLAAWVAISPETFGLTPLALGAAVLLWVAGFDILYALQDIDFDRGLGLHSAPAAMGPVAAIWLSRAMHAGSVAALVALAYLSWPMLQGMYLSATGVAAGVLLVQQALVSPGNYSRINATFTICNGTVSLLLGAAGIADVVRAV